MIVMSGVSFHLPYRCQNRCQRSSLYGRLETGALEQ